MPVRLTQYIDTRTVTKLCRKCGHQFTTKQRPQKDCDKCRVRETGEWGRA